MSAAIRTMGAVTAAAGVALILLPFANWYVASVPSGNERASGIDAAGELWLVPALGVLVLIAGIAIIAGRAPLLAGTTAAVSGALAAAWAAINIARVPVETVLDDPVDPVPVDASVAVQVAAPLTAVAGALALLAGGLVAMRGWTGE